MTLPSYAMNQVSFPEMYERWLVDPLFRPWAGMTLEAAALAPDTKSATVDPGRGAYVLSGGWSDSDDGAPYVIDAKARANPLGGADAADSLGYAGYPVVVVPDSWIGLFEDGVELSTDAVLCPPGATACD